MIGKNNIKLFLTSLAYSILLLPVSVLADAETDAQWAECSSGGVPTLKCLEIPFGNIVKFSTSFVVLILFVMIVVGAFRYLTSGGNPEGLKKAQGTLKFAIIGVVLFVSAYLILNIVGYLFLNGQPDKLMEFKIGQ